MVGSFVPLLHSCSYFYLTDTAAASLFAAPHCIRGCIFRVRMLLMQTEHFLLLLLHIKSFPLENHRKEAAFVTEVRAWLLLFNKTWSAQQDMILIFLFFHVSGSFKNISKGNSEKRNSHSELVKSYRYLCSLYEPANPQNVIKHLLHLCLMDLCRNCITGFNQLLTAQLSVVTHPYGKWHYWHLLKRCVSLPCHVWWSW